jgi:general L-amino acid transport system substrate-binding protein
MKICSTSIKALRIDLMRKLALVISLATISMLTLASQALAATLDDVLNAGELRCGVSNGLPGFSQPDRNGRWRGLDVDTCRAVAAAVLGDASAVEFIPLTASERFTALQSGRIDMLARNTQWTTTRDAALNVHFSGINYYDGQGFLVNSALDVSRAHQLDGASICVQTGTMAEFNLANYFRANNMSYDAEVFATSEASAQGFINNRCDVLSLDSSALAAFRAQLSEPSAANILPEKISKKPLGPVVRQGDDAWFNIVKWVLFGQINAEEYGINSENVANRLNSTDPNIQRIVGGEGNMGEILGLSEDFMLNVITQVGNYGEMFERNLGLNTPLGLPRGNNALWTNGGILYAPPFR